MAPALSRRRVRLAGRLAAAWALMVALSLALAPTPAHAHEVAASLIAVSEDDGSLVLDVFVPLDRYNFAYGTHLADDPEAATGDELVPQIEDAVTVSAPDGQPWSLEVGAVGVTPLQDVPNLTTRIVATPPVGTTSGPVDLDWTLVTDEVASHKVYVVATDNLDAVIRADTGTDAQILGLITTQSPVVRIDEQGPAASTTFASLFDVGFGHFREGPDHLLFLCLVALGAARRRHGGLRTAGRLLALTFAFTIGHSLSLAATTVGLINLPGALIETGIALTILVTAVHAVRPTLSSRSELAVTGLFGLIHGCGFAGTLADLSISGSDALVPLVGFNLGLEAAQMLGLLLVAVPLVVLACSTVATTAVAGAVGVVAVGWVGERALELPDPFAPMVALLAGSPERLALVLAAGAVAVLAVRRRESDRLPEHQRDLTDASVP